MTIASLLCQVVRKTLCLKKRDGSLVMKKLYGLQHRPTPDEVSSGLTNTRRYIVEIDKRFASRALDWRHTDLKGEDHIPAER